MPVVFVLVHVLCGMELACAPGTPWWTHLTYLFQHAGWWHLAVNALSFVGMSRLLTKFLPYGPVLCIGVAVAVGASFVCWYERGVVGASGVVYALIGEYLWLVGSGTIRYRDKRQLYAFLAGVLLSLCVGFFKASSAGLLHLVCLAGGYGLAGVGMACGRLRVKR